MKVKKLVRLCFFSLLAFCLCFCFFAPSQVFADETKPVISGKIDSGQSSTEELNLAYPNNPSSGTVVTLEIENFEFSSVVSAGNTVSIVYSYMKEESELFSYQELPIVNYAEHNSSKCEFNPFTIGGAGTYFVKAYIKAVNNTTKVENITTINDAFKIVIATPNAVTGEIVSVTAKYETEQSTVGDFSMYKLYVEVQYKGYPVNADNLTITWTCTNNTDDGVVYYRYGNNALFAPDDAGHYVFKAAVAEFGMTAEVDTDVSVDYTLYLIIGAIVLGVVMLGIVITTTVVKVKKERVW